MTAIKTFFTFRFKADRATGFAIGTLLLFWLVFFGASAVEGITEGSRLGLRLLSLARFVLFVMMGNVFLGVFAPVAYITHERRAGIDQLGITRRHLLPSLLISALLGLYFSRDFINGLYQIPDLDLLPFLLANLLFFGEIFFVYGWLQMRFDEAFGTIPAIMLAGLSFALYHVGWVENDALFNLLIMGLLMAFVFSLTRNLFILWPLATMMGGAVIRIDQTLGWETVILFAFVLVFQLSAFEWLTDHADTLAPAGEG